MPKGVDQEGKRHRVSVLMSVLAAAFFLMSFPESSPALDYTVKKGDSLLKLEEKFGVPWQDIKELNGLTGTTIYPGQKLAIPEPAHRNYVVKKGDSLADLEKRFGVPWRDIKELNGLSGTTIHPGQKLVIPLPGMWHVVKVQEWLLLIARAYGEAYGVTKEEIIEANRLKDPDNLVPGQRLFIPRAKTVLQIEIPPLVETGEVTASSSPPPQVLFRWPLQGEVIGYFGEGGNQGIDIAGSEGETVVAAGDGEVFYASHLILSGKNYGYTVFINHEGGLRTCYFYNASNLVEKGQKVKKGDPVAKLGIMGDSGRFGLHFEVRKMSKPVNPLDYLP